MIDTQKKAATALGKAADVLIIADSEHSADMLYATGMFVPDPFIYLRLKGREYLCMSCLLYTSPSPRDKRQSRMPSSA